MTPNDGNNFLLPISKGGLTHPNSSAWLQMLQMTFFTPIRKKKVLFTQTFMHDSICKKWLLSYSSVRESSYPTQSKVHQSKCWRRLFSCSLARVESYTTKLKCMTPNVPNKFSLAHLQWDILPTPIHDSKCCKWFFSCPLESGESYPPKLKCMAPDVANNFSSAHY